MASQEQAAAGSPPSPQLVGNAFVQQYYTILHQSPAVVYRFYQESSKLSRPGPQGVMSSVTTLQAINDKIMSMDFGGFMAEIKTVDSQDSVNGGVLVLVTGYLTGKDNVRRNFTQSFFLATQDKGYFVLNDIFRYVEEADQEQGNEQGNQALANGITASHSLEQETPQSSDEQVPEQSVSPPEEENVIEEVYNPSEDEGSIVEEEAPDGEVIDEIPNSFQATAVDSTATTIQEDAPKKSYASILKVVKENVAPSSVPVPAPARAVPSEPERQAAPAPTEASVPETPVNSDAPETASVQEFEADGHSIYIKGLPLNATAMQLEEEFKRFGPIKPSGIQVRSHKQQGFCFGFIEFETITSVQSAIEASPVMIGGRQAIIEEKRPTGSRVRGRGRFSGRMGGFRSEGSGGRGNFGGGGRGYGRGDFGSKGVFGGRGSNRVGSGRGDGGDRYQRVGHRGPHKDASPRAPAPV